MQLQHNGRCLLFLLKRFKGRAEVPGIYLEGVGGQAPRKILFPAGAIHG